MQCPLRIRRRFGRRHYFGSLRGQLRRLGGFSAERDASDNFVKVSECSQAASHPVTHVCSSLEALTEYPRGWAWQQALLNRRLDYQRTLRQLGEDGTNQPFANDVMDNDADKDRLLFFEHHSVYTLGRGADENNLTFLDQEPDGGAEKRERLSRKARGIHSARLSVDRLKRVGKYQQTEEEVDALAEVSFPVVAPNGAPIYRIERGGEVTYHGPGQLVAYPLLDLRREPYQMDLHWYLRQVEEVVIQTLGAYGIEGTRDADNTGVWVGEDKVAAVGVSSSRWITTHGFAINVSPDLSFFDTSIIIPCGIEGRGVTSISAVLKERGSMACPSLEDVANEVVCSFEAVFGVQTKENERLRL